MLNRWSILAVLFFVRLTMAFQFQLVAALSPVMIETYSVGLAEVGFLIGLYLAPGVVVAIPGSALAGRFGEKRVVAMALVLMLLGGVISAVLPGWGAEVTGRLLAGAGGVVLNIVMTKMLVDWFAGREISTAMAIFVNSWPVGIALALIVLPLIATAGGLAAARWLVLAMIAVGLAIFVVLYHPPPGATGAPPRLKVARFPVTALLAAACVWAFYNAALAMIFSFGPALLTEAGWSLAGAGSVIGAFMWVMSFVVPFGGVLADRTGRRDSVIVASLVAYVALVPLLLHLQGAGMVAVLLIVAALFSLAAGPIMTLPSAVLPAEARVFGMGVYFAFYYGVMMVAPRVAGALADRAGDSGVALMFGVAMSAICIPTLWLFRRLSRGSGEVR